MGHNDASEASARQAQAKVAGGGGACATPLLHSAGGRRTIGDRGARSRSKQACAKAEERPVRSVSGLPQGRGRPGTGPEPVAERQDSKCRIAFRASGRSAAAAPASQSGACALRQACAQIEQACPVLPRHDHLAQARPLAIL